MQLDNLPVKRMSDILKITHRALSHLILAVFLFVLNQAPVSFAGQKDFYQGILDRDRVIEAAKTVTTARYPNADVVQVDQHQWIKYQQDGTYVEWLENYTKVLTEKGKRRFKTVSSSFTIPYNSTEFKLVEIIKEDGKIITVDLEKNSSVMIERGQMASNIYNPNNKILRVNIPELNLGDIVHYFIFDNFTKVRTPDTWSDYVGFESIDPIKRSEYTVIAPREKPLKHIIVKSEIPGTITHKKQFRDGEIIYKWIAENVPQAFLEPEMPPFYTQMQRLLLSTITDWEWISRWYWSLCEPNMEKTTPEMKIKVEQLTRNLNAPREKVKAVFSWVSQEIRYLGLTVEKDSPGYEPHPVRMTFDRRSGVCRDKAALLAAMLRMAGLDAYPTLILNGPKKDPEVPQPFFNHAITSVRDADGSYLLMDSTDENTKQLFPAYLNNQSYLVAMPGGETLRTSPIEPAKQNMMHIETKGNLSKAGNLKAESVLRFDGINDNVYRGYFSRLTPDERRGYFEKITKKIMPGARLNSYNIFPANILDTTNSLEICLSFEAKDILVDGKEICMIPVLHLGNSVGMVNHLLGKMGLKQRKYPLYTRFACGVEETLELDLKQSVGKLVSLPEYELIENEGTSWSHNLSIKDNVLTSKIVFKLKIPEFSPKQYLTVKDTLKKIESDNRRMPIFSGIGTVETDKEQQWYDSFPADAVILEEEVEYDLKDATSWTETKRMKIKILSYAGKKKNSDIHISFNPIWEEVEIKDTRVTSKSGEVKVISKQEINIMDAAWAGDAPRYPAAKTMVANLPAVEVGSTIEYTVLRKKKDRPFFSINGKFFQQDTAAGEKTKKTIRPPFTINGSFRYHDPIMKKTVRLKVPDSLQLKISRADQGMGLESIWEREPKLVISEKKKSSGNKMVHEFFATKVAPVNNEDFLPPWYSFNPMIFASTGSWQNFAKTVHQVLQKAASSQAPMADKAEELINGIISDEDRITSIRDFVAKNIKFIDLSTSDLPLDQITPAARTLMDGYGNSADRAVLLYALLSAAGYHPQFVLSSRVSPVENLQLLLREHPVPEWFDDVLVRVKINQGYAYLNDTDQYALLGTTPSDGHPGLLLKTGQIMTINALSDRLKDREDLILLIELDEDGRTTIKKTSKIYGNKFASFRKKFTEMPPEKRRRYHLEMVASISQAAEADGEYITNYHVYPGVEEFSVKVDNYATRQGDYLYLNLPGLIAGVVGVKRDERKNPIYRNWFSRRHIQLEVILPDGADSIQITPPQALSFPIKRSGEIAMETRFLPLAASSSEITPRRRLSIKQDINLKPVVILPEEYIKLLKANRVLSHQKTRMLLLRIAH